MLSNWFAMRLDKSSVTLLALLLCSCGGSTQAPSIQEDGGSGEASGSPYAVTYWIDPLDGDDAHDGRSPARPLRSLAGLKDQAGGTWSGFGQWTEFLLRRGSHLLEQFGEVDDPLPAHCRLAAYGSGPRPVLDARDPIPNGSWHPHPILSAVYLAAVVPDETPGHETQRFPVWEDGRQLLRVADLDACQATPGSFWAAHGDAWTGRVAVHSSASDDPRINGSSYSFASRLHGIHFASDGVVEDMITIGNVGNNGSLVVGTDMVLRRCMAVDGTKHNILFGSGLMEDVVAWGCEGTSVTGNAALIQFYTRDGSGLDVQARGLRVIGTRNPTPAENPGIQAIGAHTDGVHFWDSLDYRDVLALYAGSVGAGAAESARLHDVVIAESNGRININTADWTASHCRLYPEIDGFLTTNYRGLALGAGCETGSLAHSLFAFGELSGAAAWLTGTVEIRRCAFAGVARREYLTAVVNDGTLQLSLFDSLFDGVDRVVNFTALSAMQASDRNQVHPAGTDMDSDGSTAYSTFVPDYRSGEPSLDQHSNTVDPQRTTSSGSREPLYAWSTLASDVGPEMSAWDKQLDRSAHEAEFAAELTAAGIDMSHVSSAVVRLESRHRAPRRAPGHLPVRRIGVLTGGLAGCSR